MNLLQETSKKTKDQEAVQIKNEIKMNSIGNSHIVWGSVCQIKIMATEQLRFTETTMHILKKGVITIFKRLQKNISGMQIQADVKNYVQNWFHHNNHQGFSKSFYK
ncbi:hypothetical protein ACJX0J_012443, partial [Zea mays]